MTRPRASSADEYIHRVRNAMFEVKDLEECLLYDADDLVRFPTLLKQINETHRKGLEIAGEDS
jgi:hypothetical protein